VSDNDYGLRVGETYIVRTTASLVVKAQDITHSLVEILRLVQQCLSVKGREVFIEIDYLLEG